MDISQWLRLPHLDQDFPLPTTGPFTLQQALTAGVPRRWLSELTQAGLLRHPIKGVHVPSQVPDTTSSRLACLGLVTPEDAVVVDRHAGWAQGANMLLLPNEHLSALPIAMYLPQGRGRLRNKLAESGERTFREADLTVVRRRTYDHAAAHCPGPRSTAVARASAHCS